LELAVILGTHENSLVFKDTLESIKYYWTKDILVLVDGKNYAQFKDEDFLCLEGFYHGKSSSPYRNVCMGLKNAWWKWGESKDWYCYIEYDCLVASDAILNELKSLSKEVWMVGNDYRIKDSSISFLNRFQKSEVSLHYLLGCCNFFSKDFMKKLSQERFFDHFLEDTNFFPADNLMIDKSRELVYDINEYLYPSLAVFYGGKIEELACWLGNGWRGDGEKYPMRFHPSLDEAKFEKACIMHPLKDYNSEIRQCYRKQRI